jgi:hypothetical protein
VDMPVLRVVISAVSYMCLVYNVFTFVVSVDSNGCQLSSSPAQLRSVWNLAAVLDATFAFKIFQAAANSEGSEVNERG